MNQAPETIFLIPGEYDGEHGLVWCNDPAPDDYSDPAEAVEYVRKDSIKITDAMIEAGAQRLVHWEDESVWPDSWNPCIVAAAKQDAERVIRSALSVLRGDV